ncbi:USP6 N-terminal-like protein isoform X2 [Oryctolagus cuniculus]|uniref:USP6 N-terminal-like protein isoform X2 n=1 Tax=Oryctolagus cuniculus TaxID=9986 RepID=UPI0038795A4E
MDTLRSGRGQEQAAIITKHEQVQARVLGEEVGPCLKHCACESQTLPPWGHGEGGSGPPVTETQASHLGPLSLQGPHKEAQFHLGEEDDESGALVPDKLRFLHKQKPPRPGCLAMQGRKHQEGRRLQKWNKMLRNFTKYHSSEKFHWRIEKGIPTQVRGKVWAMMLSVDTRKAQNPGKFEEMKERARLCSDQVQQIDEEVARTFRSHIMFRERYGAKNWAGSHVAALLLMWLSEEDAFWALVQLMGDSQHSMHDFYTPDPKTGVIQAPPERYHASRAALPGETPGEEGCVPGGLHRALVHPGFPGWECLLKMSRDHIREFLQVTLKQAWSLSEDAAIRQLRASMRELGKLQCLLPPEAKPMEDGSLAL